MPIFIPEGGYGAFGPAMLVYRENTTPITIKDCNAYFIPEGGYGAFGPAMLVYRKRTTSGIRKITTHIFMHEASGSERWLRSICSSHAGLENRAGFVSPQSFT